MAPCSGYRLLLKGVNDPDRERGAQSHAEPDTEQGHERRLYEESEPHLFPLEAKRPEHTDLLPSFDHGAGRDDAEGSDAYQEAQTHETHEQVVEESLRGRTVFDLFLYRDSLEAVLGEGFLQVFSDSHRIHPVCQPELVALRRERRSREIVHGRPRGGHARREERGVFEHPDHVQVSSLPRLRIFNLYVEVAGKGRVFTVEARELYRRVLIAHKVGPAGREIR